MKVCYTENYFVTIVTILMLITAGCTQKPAEQAEFRGVWLHPGLFSLKESEAIKQMDSLFSQYQVIGINNLFCYNTTPDENNFGWDYLEALIAQGQKKGISIHPVFYPGHTINLEEELDKNPSWLIRDMDGKYQPHHNIANPEVRKHWIGKISGALK